MIAIPDSFDPEAAVVVMAIGNTSTTMAMWHKDKVGAVVIEGRSTKPSTLWRSRFLMVDQPQRSSRRSYRMSLSASGHVSKP